MAGTLAMALTASEPLSVELYAVGESEYDDAEYAMKQPVMTMGPNERESMIQTFTRRLNGRCQGLLEISPKGDVNFLPRTVRDFLRTKQMDEFLRSKNQTRLEPALSIFKAYLSYMKQAKFIDRIERGKSGSFSGSLVRMLEVALPYVSDEYTQSDQIEPLIDEMESATIAKFAAGLAELVSGPELRFASYLFRGCIFIHIPIHHLSLKLVTPPTYFMDPENPPLTHFLRYIEEVPSRNWVIPLPSRQLVIVKTLLECGADPNQIFPDKDLGDVTTPWQRYISSIVQNQNSSAFAVGVIEELLSSGASPNAMTQAPLAVTLGHKSVLIQAWLNIFFAVFTLKTDLLPLRANPKRVKRGNLKVLTRTLEKDVDSCQ